MKKIQFIFIWFVLASLTSCLGLSIDIQLNRDGSGRLTMEYHISSMLDSLGALDGNLSMPTIPVGRADWDRTIERIEGARISSFSTRQKGNDTVTSVTIDFNSIHSLIAIIDPGNERTSISMDNRSGQLNFIINDGKINELNEENGINESLMILARAMFFDYKFSISFGAQGNSTLIITDGTGKEIAPPAAAEVITQGRKVSMSIGIMDLIDIDEGLGVIFKF